MAHTEILDRFEKALKQVQKLDVSILGDQETESIIKQLSFVIDCLKAGSSIKTDKQFVFGLYAVRDLRDFDAELSHELAELAEWVDKETAK